MWLTDDERRAREDPMKKLLLITLAASAAAAGCSNATPTIVQNSSNTNAAARSGANDRPATAIAHSTENRMPPANPGGAPASGGPGKWSASGDPVDTARFDGTIAAAEQILNSKPDDETAKKNLAQAYHDRGKALTDARQYAAALGDYRRALKYDPNHESSKNWISQIEAIYKMLNKSAPKEGEEPGPLPFNKS
jgi:tetratricopeptide (TPR) repeat protein